MRFDPVRGNSMHSVCSFMYYILASTTVYRLQLLLMGVNDGVPSPPLLSSLGDTLTSLAVPCFRVQSVLRPIQSPCFVFWFLFGLV